MSDPEIRARLKRARFNDLVGAAFGVIVMTPIAGSIMIGFVSLLFDALDWLQKAVWPVHTLESVLKHFEIYIPQTRFLGLAPFYSVLIRVDPEDPSSTTDFVCEATSNASLVFPIPPGPGYLMG